MASGNQTRYVVRHDETIAFFTSPSYANKREKAMFEMDNKLFQMLFDFELENEKLYKLPSSAVDQDSMKLATMPFLKTEVWDGSIEKPQQWYVANLAKWVVVTAIDRDAAKCLGAKELISNVKVVRLATSIEIQDHCGS